MRRAFVIRPFRTKKDSAGNEIDFERVDRELIAPALDDAGLGGGTTGEIIESGNIREDMFSLIIEADLVICDITVHNANVFYELGIRHALRKRCSVLIKGAPFADPTPFDILTDRYLVYQVNNPESARQQLAEVLNATLASTRNTDSPVFKMLPDLREIDPATIQAVPAELTEKVECAVAAAAPDHLRELASQIAGQRYQWPGLRMIGKAQWYIRDIDGGQETFEKLLANDPNDIVANLALANLYERKYRVAKSPELLVRSNEAIARVLGDSRTTQFYRAEALALRGRNQKSLWRWEFEQFTDVARRREAATVPALRGIFETYRDAYMSDLNQYWPGLASLQMGMIALDLSGDAAWQDAFESVSAAQYYRDELARTLEILRPAVSLAVAGAVKRLAPNDGDRIWAKLSAADLLFLFEERSGRVIKAYRDALAPTDRFAWDAARGQLEIFELLGIRAELATAVINAMDDYLKPPGPT